MQEGLLSHTRTIVSNADFRVVNVVRRKSRWVMNYPLPKEVRDFCAEMLNAK